MKKQTSIQRALSLRKNLSTRKKQRGSAKKKILIILLLLLAVALLLLPVIMWLSHVMQEKCYTISGPHFICAAPVDMKPSRELYEETLKAQGRDEGRRFGGEADFDNSDDGDSEEASTEMVPDSSKMALDGSSEADTKSRKEGNPE